MMLISNFLDLYGRVTEAGPQLRAYLRRCNRPAVHRSELCVLIFLNASGWSDCYKQVLHADSSLI